MADTCSGVVVSESEGRAARRRRMDLLRRVRIVPSPSNDDVPKRRRVSENCDYNNDKDNAVVENNSYTNVDSILTPIPKYGMSSVCGRRRDMEDAVTIHPSFVLKNNHMHYFGVYDGHGCSHVATKCKERLHDLVKEELMLEEDMDFNDSWKCIMNRSFVRMDNEITAWNYATINASCRCELQAPLRHAAGSTAVVAIVTPRKIVVANCGDSRAILCREGLPFPLSVDHKPDRPDELSRIEAAGGRVIYWEGARVEGFLAMSRAIGDNYLKPYVSCEPEVSVTERTDEDECLILASDGLWDVVSNETACSVARMCLKGKEKSCSDASLLLTKLALARRSADNVSVVVIDLRKPM